jgi:hypothetical protein
MAMLRGDLALCHDICYQNHRGLPHMAAADLWHGTSEELRVLRSLEPTIPHPMVVIAVAVTLMIISRLLSFLSLRFHGGGWNFIFSWIYNSKLILIHIIHAPLPTASILWIHKTYFFFWGGGWGLQISLLHREACVTAADNPRESNEEDTRACLGFLVYYFFARIELMGLCPVDTLSQMFPRI